MKPGMSALRYARLINQVREPIRYLHYSLGTQQVNVYWGRFFIRWAGHGAAMRHPRGMGDGNPPDARPAPHRRTILISWLPKTIPRWQPSRWTPKPPLLSRWPAVGDAVATGGSAA
jgi:hypothetical protein